MSMTELQSDVNDAGAFSAEEQAQFDAMRNGTELPAEPPAPVVDKAPPAGEVDPKVAVVDPGADDPDVETIKDAKGQPVMDQAGKPQKRVSFHKYQREETRRKELEEKLRLSEEKQARVDERLKIINEALETPGPAEQARTAEEEDPEPDPETQIFEHAKWQSRKIKRLEERDAQRDQQDTTREQDVEISNTYRSSALEFSRQETTFAQAYVYLLNQRDGELQEAGVKDKKLRDAQIVREERGLVKGAINDGVSPAQRIFNISVMRGFNKEAALADIAKRNGTAAVPVVDPKKPAVDPKALDAPGTAAVVTAAKPDVKAEIEAIKAGSSASLTLSGGGGEAPPLLTPQILADMPQDEFNEMVAKLSKRQLRELLGD